MKKELLLALWCGIVVTAALMAAVTELFSLELGHALVIALLAAASTGCASDSPKGALASSIVCWFITTFLLMTMLCLPALLSVIEEAPDIFIYASTAWALRLSMPLLPMYILGAGLGCVARAFRRPS